MNPIVRRELIDLLRTRKAVGVQVALAVGCAALVLVRWPTGGVADLSGARSQQVLQVFGYGLLAGVLFLVPAFPATSVVRERVSGTLALLLNTPMPPWSIYGGKLLGVLGFCGILLLVTGPAAAACYALGGVSSRGGVGMLYVVLGAACLQLATLGLYLSSRALSIDTALRTTYACVFALVIVPLAPAWLMQGTAGPLADAAGIVKCLSPLPAVAEVLGHGGIGARGMGGGGGTVPKYLLLAAVSSVLFALATVARLTGAPLDRARAAGVMTQDRSTGERRARRILFLIDPQRRSRGIGGLVNPVMAKEFMSRKLGRSHWTLRLIAVTAILSLLLSYVASSGALGWGSEAIGGALVILQAALLVLFVPSLAAGLVSSEREGKTWQLLRMTPMSPGRILRGKLLSATWPVLLLMCGTLPGYVVMATIEPNALPQTQRVVVCLALMALFAVLLSAAASSLFKTTAAATAAANIALVGVCLAPLLVWLGRGVPFGHSTVEAALSISPVAAALHASNLPGFTEYKLLPLSWWISGGACALLLLLLIVRTRQLCRPE